MVWGLIWGPITLRVPRSFMKHKKSSPSLSIKLKLLEEDKHPSQHTIRSTGVLSGLMPGRSTKGTRAAIDRTEQLLRLLLANAKPNPRKPRFGLGVRARRHHSLKSRSNSSACVRVGL